MAADIESCLTEVRCFSTRGYGTGYLIAPDLVLTACHVVAESLTEPLPPNLQIDIRTIAHFDQSIRFKDAKLVWPPADRWQELAHLDIALLEVIPDAITRAAARLISLGTGGLPRDKELQVHFTGFPRLTKIKNTHDRDTKQMFGEVAPASGVKQNLIQITIKGKPADSDKAWTGASGAAVFAQGQIIGVLTVKVVDDMVDFYAAGLDGALRDRDFSERVAKSQAAISTRAATELNLGRLVCLIDRDPQDAAFRTAFRELLSGQRVRPLCCLIYGGARHRPGDLADRFSLVTIPELRKLRPGQGVVFKPISWPSSNIDVPADLALLRAQLWNVLCDEDGSEVPSDVFAFGDRLSDESRPHLFLTELSPMQLSSEGAALWSAWSSFLDAVAACELTRPPLHLFLVSDVTRSQIELWLKQVPPTKETVRRALDELGTCKWIDFGEWIDRRVPKIAPAFTAGAAGLKDDLEGELEEMVGGPREFTASDLKQAVRKVMRQRK
jgi:hypothetical protein